MSPRIKNYLIITWSKCCYLYEFKCVCCLIVVGICCRFCVFLLPCHPTSACNCGFIFCIFPFFFFSSCWSISAAAMSALWLVMFVNIESLLKNVAVCEELGAGAVLHLRSGRAGCWADHGGALPGTPLQQDMFEQKQFAELYTLQLLPRQTLSHLS